jgi:hypothetical protein
MDSETYQETTSSIQKEDNQNYFELDDFIEKSIIRHYFYSLGYIFIFKVYNINIKENTNFSRYSFAK